MTTDTPSAGSSRSRWSAQTWFDVVLLAMAVLLGLSAVIGATVLRSAAEASNRLIDRISVGRIQSERMQTALLNQETGVRGFVLTGNEAFLQPYTEGLSAERSGAAQIREANPQADPLRELAALEGVAAQWRTRYAEPMIASVRASGAESVAETQVEESKRAFDAVRKALEEQNAAWARVRHAARAELESARTVRDMTFSAILVAFLVTIVTIAVLLRIAVFRPLAHLRAASRRVTQGDFEHHVDTGGPADLAELADDMEAMRRRIVSELEEARSSRRQIAAQAEELKRSNAELEQFAYVASHDLQEPLRKVASFCQMLQQRYAAQLDERANTYIDFAVDGAKRMQVLINELLTFSRVGRVNHDPVETDLNEAVGRALSNLSAVVEESQAEVEVGDLPVVVGDRTQLVMLWQNLIGNSLKFRVPGRAPRVRVEAERGDGQWRMTVTDNGIGIAANFADKIFVIFQRLHQRDAYEGTGIGLALCRKIVEQHGGRIWLDTEYTEGARFVLTLPVAPSAVEETEQAASCGSGTGEDHGAQGRAPAAAGATR
ncbi:signal transduction histidine kinase [Streptosporangium becharense]|uniref:histidine kinase n=1 Tax=Streptosporangium becharense TaxID=1816182 RepID=A0A7W9MF04_9ACTN|nr:ATP-binding protein [Streptosporangium becharense]MBB2913717.1 signal transduction histidine kinase [Streptosporangium becharense]MBB5817798.1 signal transduction histidine kinase [Streptosporangium becharense]